MRKLTSLIFVLFSLVAFAQQPQTGSPDPQALQGINSKWANGVGPGYWPYQKTAVCTGLNLCISSGTVPQCMGSSHVTYAGTSSFALTNNATNYVYLDLNNNCVPAVNTTGYSNRDIAIAKIVTSSGAITSLSDDRFWGGSHVVMGQVNAQTGTSYTFVAADRDKLVTLSNGSAIAVTLPTTLGSSFAVFVQNIGSGTATLTPSSGTINGASNVALTGGTGSTGQGASLFFDGTNWFAVMGGGSGGGGGGGTVIRECIVTTGDPAAASPVLTNNNSSPVQCGNDFAVDVTIVAAACWADAGTPQVTPILTGGSGTSILTGPLTCGTAAWAAGTVNGSPVLHSFNSNGATCPSTPCTLDSNISSAGASTRYIVMKYDVVGPNTGTTPVGIGTANPHEVLFNNAGSVGGIGNGTAGQSLTSLGTSSTPAYGGCHLSNGVLAKTANYSLATADDGALVTFNGTTLTATLPSPPPNATWCASVLNINSGSNLTISRNGLAINTGTSNITLLPYQSATLWTDGSNYFASTPLSGVTTTTASQTPSFAANAHNIATILNCPDSSGSGTAQSCNTSPSFTPAGGTGGPNDCVWYTTTTTNSGTGLTTNVNALGAKSIAIAGASGWTTTLTANIIPANKPLMICYDGTNWDMIQTGTGAAGGGGGGGGSGTMTLLCTATASASTELDFSTSSNCGGANPFTSTYQAYHIEVTGLTVSSNGIVPQLQFSTNGGSSWDTSSNYYWDHSNIQVGTTTQGSNGAGSAAAINLFSDSGGTGLLAAALPGLSMEFTIFDPLSTTNHKPLNGWGTAQYSSNSNNYTFFFGGYYNLTNAVNAFRIKASSGNFPAGQVKVYGVGASSGGGGGSGAWTLLCTGTASTSLNLDFTSSSNCGGAAPFTGTYVKYAIVFSALYDANAAGGIPIILFSTNGGSTYDTAANYGWSASIYGNGSATNHVSSDNCFNLAGFSDIGPDASGAFSGTLFVTVPSTGYAHIDGTVVWGRVADGAAPRLAAGNTYAGSYKIVTLPNAFRFHFDPSSCSGTAHSISAGTIKVYGIN